MAGNLGTLTLDLVARVGGFVSGMDKAERSSAKWRKQVEKDLRDVGRVAGVAIGSAAAAAAGIVVSTTKAASELRIQAGLAAAGSQEFQRYAIAADTVGISQEKLSDQLKDFNEKLGEFQRSGGGGMKDFFEQIAPKIGVTAEAFRDLSGPQALQLYYDSLEKAGLSQQEMSFYLESMASDTTALIPLLKDGGAGFKLLGDEAERAGAIMSDKTLQAADQLSAAMFVVEQATSGFKAQIAEALMPVLADLAVEFSDVTTEGYLASSMGETLSGVIKGIAATAVGAYASIDLLGKSIAGIAAAGSAATKDNEWYENIIPVLAAKRAYDNWGEVETALDVVGDDLETTMSKYADILDGIWSAGSGNPSDPNSIVNKIAEIRRQAALTTSSLTEYSKADDKVAKAVKKTVDVVAQEISALERAAEVWGLTADEVAIYSLRADGASESQLDYAQSLLDTVAGFEAAKKAGDDYADLVSDLRTEEEKRSDTLREQLAIIDAMKGLQGAERDQVVGRAAAAAFDEAPTFDGGDSAASGPLGELSKLDDAEDKLNDWYETQLEALNGFRSSRADLNATWDEQERALKQQHEDSLANIERARWQTGLAATSEFLTQIQGLRDSDNKKGKAAAKAAAIVQATINAYTAATGAYASASAIPVVGWVLGPVAAAAALAAGLANVAQIKGQAHDGIMSVPNSGTWNLEKGERVLTAQTSATMDKTLAEVQASQKSNPSQVIINADFSGMSNAREARESTAQLSRQVAGAVGRASRYT